MSRDLLVAVDAGTSVIKALAFDLKGRQMAAATRPNRYERRPNGGAEQDMAGTWRDAAATLRDLAGRVEALPARVASLAVTGQGDGTWLVDEAGEPAAPAWLWLDSRAAEIVAEFDANGVRHDVYRRTGCGMNPCNQSAQLAWLQRHAPELLDRATTAMHCKDWLYLKMTGVRATDISEGVFTFGDFRTRQYAPEIIERIGLGNRCTLLPDMVDGSMTTHPLASAAAAELGLPAGIPVSLGYVDVICTALGAGLYQPGRNVGCSIIGSTGMHMRLAPHVDDVVLAAEPTGYVMPFPVPGTASQMQSNMAATLNIDWMANLAAEAAQLFGHDIDRRSALTALDGRVLDGRPGALLFHPYIDEAGERGPFLNPAARAQFIGLSARSRFLDLARAVYEGLAMAACDCYGAMGHAPEEIRVAGGAAQSRSLKLILASAIGVPIRESSREEAGAAGAAMMAAVAIGAYPDMAAACLDWVTPTLRDTIEPDHRLHEIYRRLFPIYVAARKAMPQVWAELAAMRARSDT